MANTVTLSKQYSKLSEHDIWVVRVVTPEGDSTEEGYSTLDEAIAYIRDVADRPLRDVPWSRILDDER